MRHLAVFILSVFLISCSTVVRLPSSTGQMPMVGGGLLKGRAGLDLSTAVPVTIIDDITTAPPTRTSIEVGRDGSLGSILGIDAIAGSGLDIGVGLSERVDFYLTRAVGLRWMIHGDPKGNGVKAVVFVGYGDKSVSSTSTVGASSYGSETQMPYVEYGFSVGKSMSDSGLVYLTMGSSGGTAKTKVTHSSGTVYNFEDQVEHYTATVGYAVGTRFYGKFEVSANHIVWKGSPYGSSDQLTGSNTIGGGTLGFGWRW